MASLKAHEDAVAELRRAVAELEDLLVEQRQRLKDAEAALVVTRARLPQVGDFARSTLTNFYGRVTQVTPRPGGKAWIEINPYLTPTLPGRSTIDLFDAWEMIDDPAETGEPAEATGEEIVAQLTQTLAAFAPPPALSEREPSVGLPSVFGPAANFFARGGEVSAPEGSRASSPSAS